MEEISLTEIKYGRAHDSVGFHYLGCFGMLLCVVADNVIKINWYNGQHRAHPFIVFW
jgi:hypothetical protein